MDAATPPTPERACPSCKAQIPGIATRCPNCWTAVEPIAAVRPPLPPPPPGTKLYKVLTQRDAFFKARFNPEALQDLVNTHAAEGWRVVSMTATDVGSFMGSFWGRGGGASRQELIVLLEKSF